MSRNARERGPSLSPALRVMRGGPELDYRHTGMVPDDLRNRFQVLKVESLIVSLTRRYSLNNYDRV